MTSSIVGTVVIIVFIGLLGMLALVARGTAKRTKWGVNLRPVQCPRCRTLVSARRKPSSITEAFLGRLDLPQVRLQG
jgi:hypothetical protein